MYIWKGQMVSEGIAMGNIIFHERKQYHIPKLNIENVRTEVSRFVVAVAFAKGQLQTLYEQSLSTIGQQDALIFGIHQMILEDEEFYDTALHLIKEQRINAEYAIYEAAKRVEECFYKQGRTEDIWDVAERLFRILIGDDFAGALPEKKGILVVDELFPSEVMKLDATKIKGIVLKKGSVNSHAAILIRSRQIPAIIGSELMDVEGGIPAILDAGEGILYVEPDADTIARMNRKKEIENAKKQELLRLKNAKTKMHLCANVGNMEDVERALEAGADGIGLVRSEMLCMKEQEVPSEEKQFQIYREILQKMNGKKVVIRTWDFGEDKIIKGLDTHGLRGIRLCLGHPKLFKEQLRALCRASVYGNLSILLPMISSVEEVKSAKQILKEVQEELSKEGKEFDRNMRLGVMIETPAAVLVSRQLAKEVDFFSIGTNDLTQYTLGIDRQRDSYDPHHPALMELVRMTVQNAHTEGITVGICGELGADESLTKMFATMGVDELSVMPSKVLSIRKELHGAV